MFVCELTNIPLSFVSVDHSEPICCNFLPPSVNRILDSRHFTRRPRPAPTGPDRPPLRAFLKAWGLGRVHTATESHVTIFLNNVGRGPPVRATAYVRRLIGIKHAVPVSLARHRAGPTKSGPCLRERSRGRRQYYDALPALRLTSGARLSLSTRAEPVANNISFRERLLLGPGPVP